MILLRFKCDNIFMFKDLDLDMTYKRKVSDSLLEEEYLEVSNNINVKKAQIILGANSSGKTTLGKGLCMGYNFITGKDITGFMGNNLIDFVYDKSESFGFSLEFVIDSQAYFIDVEFNKNGLVKEKLYMHKIYKSYNIETLRDRLHNEGSLIDSYENNNIKECNDEVNIIKEPYQSKILNNDDNKKESNRIKAKVAYHFHFSEFTGENLNFDRPVLDLKMLERLLKVLDPSVDKLSKAVSKERDDIEEKSLDDSFYIHFNNGAKIIVPDGDPRRISQERISHGTSEALHFTNVMSRSKNSGGIVYSDEQLSHVHTEVEKFLIMELLLNKNNKSQVFYTTHNESCLELNLPMHSFLLMRRDENHFNQITNPESKMNKSDRNLLNYVRNNYFNTVPDIDNIHLFDEHEEIDSI